MTDGISVGASVVAPTTLFASPSIEAVVGACVLGFGDGAIWVPDDGEATVLREFARTWGLEVADLSGAVPMDEAEEAGRTALLDGRTELAPGEAPERLRAVVPLVADVHAIAVAHALRSGKRVVLPANGQWPESVPSPESVTWIRLGARIDPGTTRGWLRVGKRSGLVASSSWTILQLRLLASRLAPAFVSGESLALCPLVEEFPPARAGEPRAMGSRQIVSEDMDALLQLPRRTLAVVAHGNPGAAALGPLRLVPRAPGGTSSVPGGRREQCALERVHSAFVLLDVDAACGAGGAFEGGISLASVLLDAPVVAFVAATRWRKANPLEALRFADLLDSGSSFGSIARELDLDAARLGDDRDTYALFGDPDATAGVGAPPRTSDDPAGAVAAVATYLRSASVFLSESVALSRHDDVRSRLLHALDVVAAVPPPLRGAPQDLLTSPFQTAMGAVADVGRLLVDSLCSEPELVASRITAAFCALRSVGTEGPIDRCPRCGIAWTADVVAPAWTSSPRREHWRCHACGTLATVPADAGFRFTAARAGAAGPVTLVRIEFTLSGPVALMGGTMHGAVVFDARSCALPPRPRAHPFTVTFDKTEFVIDVPVRWNLPAGTYELGVVLVYGGGVFGLNLAFRWP